MDKPRPEVPEADRCVKCDVEPKYVQPNGRRKCVCLPCINDGIRRRMAGRHHDRYLRRKDYCARYRRTDQVRAMDRKRAAKRRLDPVEMVKGAARLAVKRATDSGKLKRPAKCGACGSKGRVHGHHDDYAKPLAVRWLCPTCHTDAHRALAATGRGRA